MRSCSSTAQEISNIISKTIGTIRRASSDSEKRRHAEVSLAALASLYEPNVNTNHVSQATKAMQHLATCYQKPSTQKALANHDLVNMGILTKEQLQESRLMNQKLAEERVLFTASIALFEAAYSAEKSNNFEEALLLYRMNIALYAPAGMAHYSRPAIMLEKLKRYQEAIEICQLALKRIIDAKAFQHRICRLHRKLSGEKAPAAVPSRENSHAFVPHGTPTDSQGKDDWELSISFSKSTSPNLERAIFLAKMAPRYVELKDDSGNAIHQAFYSAAASDFLAACLLYELVENWKSAFVFINGRLVDRKLFSQVKYCYGDRCRSGNEGFCFGASQFTENPFGCHRTLIHATNNPWWTFTEKHNDGYYYVQKERLATELLNRIRKVYFCPALDIDRMLAQVVKLPDRLSGHDFQKLHTFPEPINITLHAEEGPIPSAPTYQAPKIKISHSGIQVQQLQRIAIYLVSAILAFILLVLLRNA